MTYLNPNPPTCPVHGKPTKRRTCITCMSAYQREYLRRRRAQQPALEMWHRAKKRADHRGIRFSLARGAVDIPTICPALGIPLVTGQKRSATSPSLDRIQPRLGYVPGNIRVLSDRANRMKGNLTLAQLQARANAAKGEKREAYLRLAQYVDRELILAEVRAKAAQGGRAGEVWAEVADFLDRAFVRADWRR